MDRRAFLGGAAAAATLPFTPSASAQSIVKIPNIIELSGAGATVGNNWRNGSSLAVEEINAAGGILGSRIQLEFVDTATDPGRARAAIQRALDESPVGRVMRTPFGTKLAARRIFPVWR
jgi:branched-chain amino acid transport system substrate-binding protein